LSSTTTSPGCSPRAEALSQPGKAARHFLLYVVREAERCRDRAALTARCDGHPAPLAMVIAVRGACPWETAPRSSALFLLGQLGPRARSTGVAVPALPALAALFRLGLRTRRLAPNARADGGTDSDAGQGETASRGESDQGCADEPVPSPQRQRDHATLVSTHAEHDKPNSRSTLGILHIECRLLLPGSVALGCAVLSTGTRTRACILSPTSK
jgi:hypothetical protein